MLVIWAACCRLEEVEVSDARTATPGDGDSDAESTSLLAMCVTDDGKVKPSHALNIPRVCSAHCPPHRFPHCFPNQLSSKPVASSSVPSV